MEERLASYTVVRSLKEVEEKICLFEVSTTSSFTIYKRNKGFSTTVTDDLDLQGHRVYWEDSYNEEGRKIQMCYNCPFIIIGQEIRECHNGPDRNHKKKIKFKNEQDQNSQSDHNYNQKGRTLIQDSKKMQCPARIAIKRILRFPDFKIQNFTTWKKKEASKALRKVIQDSDVNKVDEYHIMFPKNEDHKFHLQGEFAGLSLPVGEEVKAKIKELAGDGVTKVSEMKRHLKIFTKNLGIDVSSSNRRYHPNDKDIRNHMDAFKRQFRFSKDDQVNLQKVVEKWKEEHPEDNFFLRTCLSQPDNKSAESDENFIFVHQSSNQKRLLGLYGKEICLLDATYGTSKYDLPLFFICVNTNVGYINVATFIISDEKSATIKEALQLICQWNEEWEPPYFMTDNDAREIAALEEVFPNCQVYLCEFHREQAWDRWLKKHQNGCSESKDQLIKMFRSLADSPTLDEYYDHVLELTTHPLWQGNERLRNWFEPRWLGHKERWVRLFKDNLFNIQITTTNGLERQHLKLKKMYLADTSDTSLSSLLTIIIQRFNPDSYERYIQNNIRCLQGYRAYADFIPKFLHNRPKKFISHCLSRMPPAVTEIPQENFVCVGGKEFNVQSVDTNNVYNINLDKPACSCYDFKKHHLPCKHILAAIVIFPNLNWDDLPDNFTGASNFNLDPCIFDDCATLSNDASTSNVTLSSTRKSSKRSKCVEIIKKMETSIYNINEEDLDSVYRKLEVFEKELIPLVPTEHGLPVRSIPAKKNKPRTAFRGKKDISLIEMNEVSSNFMDVKKSLSELTNVEIDEIQVAGCVQRMWEQARESYYIVAKVNGMNITDTDIRSLNYNSWLTDQVIDAYLGCLSQWENDKGGNMYCIPQFTMTKILEGDCNFETTLRRVQLLKYNKLIGAFHQNRNHWTLLVIEPDVGSLYFYNSMGESEQQQMMILNNWRTFIESRKAGGLEDAFNVEWNIRSKTHSKQNDSHSCGIYTLIFAERHLANTTMVGIGQGELQSSRRRIANKLMLFEVYLRDCCPCCGMKILQHQVKVTCMQCQRDFHQTPHCVGDQNIERVDFNCVQCELLTTEHQSMTCIDEEKKIKSTVKRKDTGTGNNGELMNKKSKLMVNRSPLEISLGILHDKEFSDSICNTFIQSVSCLDWSISWDSIVDIFVKLKSSLPKIRDTLISKVTAHSLGHFGDGYIDLIPKKFIDNFQFPADLDMSGTISLFTSVSILWYGDDSHVHLLRLQTLVRQVLEFGKNCDSEEEKELIKVEMSKEFGDYSSDILEDKLAFYHLKHLPEAIGASINLYMNGSQKANAFTSSTLSRTLNLMAVKRNGDKHLTFLPIVEGLFFEDRDRRLLDECGCQGLCQGGNAPLVKCVKCLQSYHSTCISNSTAIGKFFQCGCHVQRPYKPKSTIVYTEEISFFNELKKLDFKSLCQDISRKKIPSFRWNEFSSTNCKKIQNLKDFNNSQWNLSVNTITKLANMIKECMNSDLRKVIDVFLPEVMVHFVIMSEGLNRYQAELFLQYDLSKVLNVIDND